MHSIKCKSPDTPNQGHKLDSKLILEHSLATNTQTCTSCTPFIQMWLGNISHNRI